MYKESKFSLKVYRAHVEKITTLAMFQFLEISNVSRKHLEADIVGGSRQQRIIMAKLVTSWLRRGAPQEA